MGQNEGKPVQNQNAEPAEPAPASSNVPIPASTQSTNRNNTENTSSTPNTNTPPTDPRFGTTKTNEVLKRSTDEIVGGINKLGANLISTAKGGANLISTAKGAVQNTNVSALKKAATAVVEDAIVTVKAGIIRTEEEPELEAVGKMSLFFPLIRSSVPISDLAKGLPIQKTTIAYLDPKSILVALQDYQRFLVVTSKMISARQAELSTKVKDTEMSAGRKAVFTLAMKVTDMRHFSTQFSEVGRFHSNMEKTKQSINDILGMFEKLNAILPPDAQMESFASFAASNPTLSSHSSGKFTPLSSHSSLNYANMNFPTSSHSSGSFAGFATSHSSGKFSSLTSHSSMKFSTTASNPPTDTPNANSANLNTTNTNTTTIPTSNTATNTETTNLKTTNSETTNTETTTDVITETNISSETTNPNTTNLNVDSR